MATAAVRASSSPLGDWAVRNIRLDGRPFTFDGHEYLRAMFDDPAQHVVLEKGAQVGGTTWALLRAIRACLEGLSAGYYFPTRTDVIDFSKSRVAPLIADNEFLRRAVADTDTAGLKRIGTGTIYFRGMQSQVGMKSIPVDLLVFDELDEATPDAKAMAKERLAHSDYRRIIELSNPSVPDFGIDAAYLLSDQRHWTLKCPGCGRWTAPDKAFPTKLGEDIPIIRPRRNGDDACYWACPHCEAELDLAAGEWVADYPDRRVHGYRISQLISAKVPPAEILAEYLTTRHPVRFYNLKIGIAWLDVADRLTEQQVLALCGEAGMEESSEAPTTMGVDTGKELHVVIGRRQRGEARRRIIWLGACQSYGELDDLMRRFKVGRCVIDALPEQRNTREFARRHPGRVFCNYFSQHQKGSVKWDKEQHLAQENRTEALDASRMAIRRAEVVLPRQSPLVEEFARHLTCDVKRLEVDAETGAQEYRYIRTGANHFSMAFTYENLAADSYREAAGAYLPGRSATEGRLSVRTSKERFSVSISRWRGRMPKLRW